MIDVTAYGRKGKALYDPGSNVSIISKEFFDKLNLKSFSPLNRKVSSISGAKEILGISKVKLKVFNYEKKIPAFIISFKNQSFDMILGLDSIPTFGLSLDHNLTLTQSNPNSNSFN